MITYLMTSKWMGKGRMNDRLFLVVHLHSATMSTCPPMAAPLDESSLNLLLIFGASAPSGADENKNEMDALIWISWWNNSLLRGNCLSLFPAAAGKKLPLTQKWETNVKWLRDSSVTRNNWKSPLRSLSPHLRKFRLLSQQLEVNKSCDS